MPRDENDRRMIALRNLPLQIEAVDIRQLDIEDEAGWDVRLVRADIIAGRCESDGAHAVRRQKFAERLPDARIVIYDEYDMVVRRHAAAFASTGRAKMNFVPCGLFFSSHSRPPCDSTIERQIASPIPMPLSFVVKNGSNILSGNSTPGPRSLISVSIASAIWRTRRLRTLASAVESIASMPLRIRLISTC